MTKVISLFSLIKGDIPSGGTLYCLPFPNCGEFYGTFGGGYCMPVLLVCKSSFSEFEKQ